jgi:hypothetical protein
MGMAIAARTCATASAACPGLAAWSRFRHAIGGFDPGRVRTPDRPVQRTA